MTPDFSTVTANTAAKVPANRIVFWHAELPPLDMRTISEHALEANSIRVHTHLEFTGELWDFCYESLMAEARRRLEQEVARLGGRCAHVLSESVMPQHDERRGEGWLHGQFTYALLA